MLETDTAILASFLSLIVTVVFFAKHIIVGSRLLFFRLEKSFSLQN